MKSFESYYPCDDLLGDTKFDEFINYIQSHLKNKNEVNDISKGNPS